MGIRRAHTADALWPADALFVSVHRGGVAPLSTVAAVAILNGRVAQAGGWDTPRMVLRDGERLLAERNAVAWRWKK